MSLRKGPGRRASAGRLLALAAVVVASSLAARAAYCSPTGSPCPCAYLGVGVPWAEYAQPAKLSALVDGKVGDYILVDVREREEYEAGHIRTAVNMPVGSILDNPPAARKDSLIIVYCKSGKRSARAAGILEGLGYKGVIDFGGIDNWKEELTLGPEP